MSDFTASDFKKFIGKRVLIVRNGHTFDAYVKAAGMAWVSIVPVNPDGGYENPTGFSADGVTSIREVA